jgi:hypothetical protein
MRNNHRIVPTEPSHLAIIADRLRFDDVDELAAAGLTPHGALWRSYRRSIFCQTAFVGDDIAAVFGVGGCPLGRVGEPWLLTAPAVELAKTAMILEGRGFARQMLGVFPELRGKVSADYRRACRFLEVLGFNLSEPFAFGPRLALFREYTLRRQA